MLRKCDALCCPVLEVSGSLAGLAFKAGNEMPALVVSQPRARGSLQQSTVLAGAMELRWPSLALSERGTTEEHNEIKLTKSHSSELVCLSVFLSSSSSVPSPPQPSKTNLF